LLDIELPDGNGLDLLASAAALNPVPVTVVMTGHGTEWAQRALDSGATDFLAKPFDSIRLRVTVQNAMRRKELNDQIDVLSQVRDQLGGLIGSSPAMRAVYDAVERIAAADGTVLILGESGTGKELAARAVHDLSARAPDPFIVVDCAAISVANFEREFFGEDAREGGTGWVHRGLVSRAEGGSLFLDEVAELDYAAQSLLLRFIESGVFRSLGAGAEASADVRIIASSNRDLLEEVRAGRLREDLYYRLQVLPIRLPPLRERLSDVAELASIMLNRLAVETGRSLEPLSGDAKARLLSLCVARQRSAARKYVAVGCHDDDWAEIGPHIIDEAIAQFDSQSEATSAVVIDPESLDTRAGEVRPLWLVEKEAIQNAIEVSDGNINRAAILLEVAPSTIYRKVQAWKDG
jgi:two-component system repressor protein LuxO